jgi:tyrosine decarboxylase
MVNKAGQPKTPMQAAPLTAWFLGPRAENAQLWEELLRYIFRDYVHWRRNYFPTDPVVVGRVQRRSDAHEAWIDDLTAHLDVILNELKQHFPFHSPRYIAHMTSEQTLPAAIGYFAGMLFDPNNVSPEGAPITVPLELEVGRMVAEMLGYNPKRAWAHICSGGTIANLEALWVARSAQFVPFVMQEFCTHSNLPFVIKTANGMRRVITELSKTELIALRPNEALYMLRRLVRFVNEQSQRPHADILHEINTHLRQSAFNPARRGLYTVLEHVGLKPVIFVSAAAHYSVVKAANVLGYGEDAVRLVPVTSRFQVDIEELRSMLFGLQPDEYVAAVIGIVGTTEEGAVDPIHKLCFLRETFESQWNKSFWLHVDAAWGGYIRSLFCGLNRELAPCDSTLEAICDNYVRALKVEEKFRLDAGLDRRLEKVTEIRWADKDIYAAFLAMADADSITVDPHKMGYVPYPAGMIAFHNGLVTELVQQRAQYITEEAGGLKSVEKPVAIHAVGPFILEGSKPGAAALACWLAHRTIPLVADGHGKIVRTTLLSAQKLFKYLVNHRHFFMKMHYDITGDEYCSHPFTFAPLFEPDTNILCFIVRPMMQQQGILQEISVSLQALNALNEAVYARASIADLGEKEGGSSTQPYFVSRTRFEARQYSPQSLSTVLERIGVAQAEYSAQGLFVLRSTVMNPWYYLADQAGMDYLYQFVAFLHKVAWQALRTMAAPAMNEARSSQQTRRQTKTSARPREHERSRVSAFRFRAYGSMDGGETVPLTIEKVAILKSINIFTEMPEYVLAALASLADEVHLQPGETFIQEGELGDCMYIIMAGEVRVHSGQNTILTLGPGQIVGELAILDPAPRVASVTTLQDTRLLRIDKDVFDEVLNDWPEIGRDVIRTLCQRLRAASQRSFRVDLVGAAEGVATQAVPEGMQRPPAKPED